MQSDGKQEFASDFEVKLDKMFMGTSATGIYAYAPSSSLPLPRSPKQWENEQNLEGCGDSQEILQLTYAPTKKKRSGGFDEGKRVVKKPRRVGGAALIAKKIDRLCEALENRWAALSKIKSAESESIKEVMKVVTSLPGAEQGTKLWVFASKLFLNQDNREMFCTIEDPEFKLKWLKFERRVESTSIKEVMETVKSLHGAEQGTKLWLFATRLFLNQDKREKFCTMEDPDLQLEWLKSEMTEK